MSATIKKLTAANFFKKYIIHPKRDSLSNKDKRIATVASIIFGILSLGLLHLGVAIVRGSNKLYKLLTEDDEDTQVTEAAQDVANHILRRDEPSAAKEPIPAPAQDAAAPVATPEAKPAPAPEPPPKTPREVLNDLAKEFALKAKAHDGRFALRGIPNLGNTCYMNAALQNIEALILSQPSGEALLKQDLSFEANETIEGIEKRVLHAFAPIEEPAIVMEVDRSTNHDDAAYEAFKESTRKIRREMLRPDYLLKLEIKWSLLVLLQVKQFGTDQQLKEAIEAHRDHFFDKKKFDFTKINRANQLDSGDYMRLMINMLGLDFPVVEYIERQGQPPSIKKDTRSVLDIRPKFMAEKPESFQQLLAHAFLNEETIDSETKTPLIKSQRLAGEAPSNLIIRIERNFNGLLNRFVVTDDMIPDPNRPDKLIPIPRAVQLPDIKDHQEKNNARIVFEARDIEAIDLGRFYTEEKEAVYRIIGVNVHYGYSQLGGHYFSYIRRGNDWFLLDDNAPPQKITMDKVPFEHASMLTLQKMNREPEKHDALAGEANKPNQDPLPPKDEPATPEPVKVG